MIPKNFVSWLHDIARAVYVVEHAPKGEKLDGYAVETIKTAVAGIKSLRQHLEKVEAAFNALVKAN